MTRIQTGPATRILAFILFVVAVIAAHIATPVADALPPGLPPAPSEDPFYAQPPSLADARMGEVLDSRPIEVRDIPTSAPLTSWQVKYVSQDTKGTPWTTVATILQPVGGARISKLVAFDPWIDALSDRCNPSYQLRAGTAFLASTGMIAELPNLVALLDRGYTVVVPDFLGPYNHFTAAYVEGRNTLDGVRAALNFAPLGLSAQTPVGMLGYSGGARGTEFAAELAPDYAPELNLVGVVVVGMPMDLSASGRRMNKGPFAGIDMSSVFGLARAYPELHLPALFTDPDLDRELGDMCNTDVLARYAFADGHDATVGRIWPMDPPPVAAVVESIRAGRLGTPRAPLYLAVGDNDNVALPEANDRLAADYRARGVDLTYVRLPLAEHISSGAMAAPMALAWLADHLDRA
ncbi:lipase family protein [Nocardia pseudobrasiliensis]|uniref:Secretory lipase n=1 Tax=Nocardia pseudobrasiliensis TaxID=45979 RepID=A0A370IBE0_9NOCA|nr:lipase family protein [Nocardia pseudobrasiliensis]RDI68049.1 secretory lipase [Nocardia pseudobrasiliensis]